ncbi:hypothetical protein SSX86_003744 [Deinandra increscens subsp. villosa]|uniref:Uncharacterized protein n=1 Tax=Deinandra increscens subsp. villosa TaxID=3103831 RepID=A0AAP0H853_9ASTR
MDSTQAIIHLTDSESEDAINGLAHLSLPDTESHHNGWIYESDNEPVEVVPEGGKTLVISPSVLTIPSWRKKDLPLKVYMRRKRLTNEEKGKAPMVEEPTPPPKAQKEQNDPCCLCNFRFAKIREELTELNKMMKSLMERQEFVEEVSYLDKDSLDKMHDRIRELERTHKTIRELLDIPK